MSRDLELNTEHLNYLEMHARRIAYAINAIADYRRERPLQRLLDIGPHFLTRAICEYFPDLQVSTLGWTLEEVIPTDQYFQHIPFDLNDAGARRIPTEEQQFDLIVFSETLEHLYTSPETVLAALRPLLSEKGCIFIQTPNAVKLRARWAVLRGRNPYHLIRVDRTNPGHFREYTMDELVRYAENGGFVVRERAYCDYWAHPVAAIRWVENAIPSFRPGISILIEKA